MRSTLAFTAAAAAVFACAAAPARADHAGKIPWVKNPEEGFALARATGRPSMVFFTASW